MWRMARRTSDATICTADKTSASGQQIFVGRLEGCEIGGGEFLGYFPLSFVEIQVQIFPHFLSPFSMMSFCSVWIWDGIVKRTGYTQCICTRDGAQSMTGFR